VIPRKYLLRFWFAASLAFMLTFWSVTGVSAQDVGAVMPDTNVGRWSFLVGFFLPLAAAAVIKQRWSSQVKGGAVFVLSAIAAAGTSFFAGDLQGGDFISAALIILVMASITYQTLWKPTGIAPAIEARTG
jgi:hypothetical protein